MTEKRAEEIVNTVCRYMDIYPKNAQDFRSMVLRVIDIADRKCKHAVAMSRTGKGPWEYSTYDGFHICQECGAKLKVKEWEEDINTGFRPVEKDNE